ncbi:RTA1 like protein-domain-containing protein [Leptodontidium sp. 2 PMI_412]|nr:RTA1 like protein-domain-containing protein [Leptodontidium sp. 2 PMI_412]
MASSNDSPFGYNASFPLAIVGAILFCLVGIIHFYQFFRYQTYCFYPMLLALIMEMAGFISRVYSIHHTTVLSPFLISYITIILAPSFIAAACYIVFGRVIWLVTPHDWRGLRSLWVPARWITPIFVTLDLLSFLIQLAGLGSVASAHNPDISPQESQKRLDSGISTLRTGLIVQLLGFGIFTIIGARFIFVSRKWKSDWPEDGGRWLKLAWAINISCALIILRAIYRVIEFTGTQGQGSYFERYEWPFWVFDVLIVLSVFTISIIVHPGRYLPSPYRGFYLSKKTRNANPPGVISPLSLDAIVGTRGNHTRIATSDSEATHLEQRGQR